MSLYNHRSWHLRAARGLLLAFLCIFLSGAVSHPEQGGVDIDACVGGERGFLATTLEINMTIYSFLATVPQGVTLADIICWVPGDRRVTVDPPAVKVHE